MGRYLRTGAVLGAVLIAAVVIWKSPQRRRDPFVFTSEETTFRVVTLTEHVDTPWSIAFHPGGDMLVTELPGRLRRIHDGKLEAGEISGAPKVETNDQAGLMDIALHPRFAETGLVYLTYSKPGLPGNTPALARARLAGNALQDLRDIFVAEAWSTSGGNTGSRIVFGTDGMIYMSVGDRHEQKPAQEMWHHKGKIVRLRDDGSVPEDNPFAGRADVAPEIFASGVRNPQGLFVEPGGTIWESEHGQMGGDEINVLLPGHNYGWPAITFGRNYDGTVISNETTHEGMDQPIVHWTPSIAPSGLTIYSGDRFPAWRGNAFVGALAGQHLRRVVINDRRVTHQEELLSRLGRRIRDVRQGPDGLLYVLTEEPSAVLRLEPVP